MNTERWLSPSLFALVALCFTLPFATVSCDDATTSFTGVQLVTWTVPHGGVLNEAPDCSNDISVCVERTAAPIATFALLAAFAGLALGLFGIVRGPGWCALVGLLAVIYLPFSGGLFGPTVTTHSGYVLALLLFICTWVLHIVRAVRRLRRRRAARPFTEGVAHA
jgi:hypothetical protein